MPYLICDKCNSYYEIQDRKEIDDLRFCECGKRLKYFDDHEEYINGQQHSKIPNTQIHDEKALLEHEMRILSSDKELSNGNITKQRMSEVVHREIQKWALIVIASGIIYLGLGYGVGYGDLTFILGFFQIILGIMLFSSLIGESNPSSKFYRAFLLIIGIFNVEITLVMVLLWLTDPKLFNPLAKAGFALIISGIMIWESLTFKR